MRRPECGRCTLYTTVTGLSGVCSAVGEEAEDLGANSGTHSSRTLRKHEYIQHLETVRRSSYGTESTVPAAGPRPSTIYYILPIYILRKVM